MNNFWEVLNIEGKQIDREIAVAFLEPFHCGVYDLDHSCSIYFENPKKEIIENIILSKGNIKKWNWSKEKKKNWNKNWKPFFKELIISESIKIIPSWHNNNINNNDNYITIMIDPGMAFGTGHHETTFMMIEALHKYFKKGDTIIDIGTGTGVLSILSEKLGASKVISIDNDKEIKSNFNLNKNNNNSLINLDIMSCFDIKDFNYDIILANINKNILTKLIPTINSKNNLIILSGILLQDFKSIESILFKKNFKIIEKINKGEWICLIVRTI